LRFRIECLGFRVQGVRVYDSLSGVRGFGVRGEGLFSDDSLRVCWFLSSSHPPGKVPRGEKMLCSGTDPESYITEHTLVYEE